MVVVDISRFPILRPEPIDLGDAPPAATKVASTATTGAATAGDAPPAATTVAATAGAAQRRPITMHPLPIPMGDAPPCNRCGEFELLCLL